MRLQLFLLLLIVSVKTQAQSWQKTNAGIKTTVNNVAIEIAFYSPTTVRIIKSPAGSSFTKNSLSVIASPQKTSIVSKQQNDNLAIKSEDVMVKCNLTSGAISFYNKTGTPLLSEKENSTSFKPFNDAGSNTNTVEQSYTLDKEEAIYGLGQQQQGKMVQRNLTLNMVQGNTDDYVPFFQSAKGYGLFWDNYSPTVFSDNTESTSFKSDVGDCIDYYFMYGGNADGVIGCMRNLTGQAPMFPLWTYGFFKVRNDTRARMSWLAL
jgi:alpha-D-xyloside xylohydrolase